MNINRDTGIVSDIDYVESPNQGGQLVPDSIVIHYTAQTSTKGAIRSLSDPTRKVSAHFVLGRDGLLTQMVPLNRVAWHAGKSSYNGRVGYNKYSIGIEIVNAGPLSKDQGGLFRTWYKGSIPEDEVEEMYRGSLNYEYWHLYTKAQLDTLWNICALLVDVYGIKEVVGHEEISPGRKTDPGPAFPLDRFRDRLLNSRDQEDGAEYDIPEDSLTGVVNVPPGETLNLRATNHGDGSILGEITNGAQVKILDEEGRWTKVSIEGYVAGRYVK